MALFSATQWLLLLAFCFQMIFCEESDDMGLSLLGVATAEIDAMVGGSAQIPCDIQPDSHDDRVYMVLWFRYSGGKPLYSFDVRGRSFNKALHWSDPLVFGRRAYFVTISQPAALAIDVTQLDDEGIYRCRVDFKNSPTRNFQIKLNIIVPPHKMLLYDEHGRDIAGVVGPMEEGGSFKVFCELRGGRPTPQLRWLMDNETITDYVVEQKGKVTISSIELTHAKRSWLNKTVRCQANNTKIMTPHERSARIEMWLRPKTVNIITKPKKVSADEEITLICVSTGSRPPAQITWIREKRRYNIKGKQEEHYHDNSTTSYLTMKPQPEDDGVMIKCRAENRILSNILEDFVKMEVVYKPVVGISLGSTLNANEIKEGDDVYFECNIKSNPKENRIDWFHNDGSKVYDVRTDGRSVSRNGSAGMFISTKSLVLQKVSRVDAGLYSCKVANDRGETSSPELYLRIQYAPACITSNPVMIGAVLDYPIRVRCTVHADPANVSFYWQFNNSGESFQVSPARYGPSFLVASGGTASELRYRAASERDYGALTCRANNSIGRQKHPCVFQIVPAVKPQAPENCTAFEIPRENEKLLAIRCLEGFDGGIRAYYTLQVSGTSQILINTSRNDLGYYEGHPINASCGDIESLTIASAACLENVTEKVLWLNVTWSALESIENHRYLIITSRNAKGSSEPVFIEGIKFQDPHKKKKEEDGSGRRADLVRLVIACIALVVLLAGGVAIIALLCKKRPETASAAPSKRPSQSVVQVDSQGRRYMIAYPSTPTSEKESKPDILNPKSDNTPPRVVLESSDGNSFVLRELRPELRPGRSNDSSPEPEDAVRPISRRPFRESVDTWT